MGMIGTALKIGVLAKIVQVVQREARKPENREKINAAMGSAKQRSAQARDSYGRRS